MPANGPLFCKKKLLLNGSFQTVSQKKLVMKCPLNGPLHNGLFCEILCKWTIHCWLLLRQYLQKSHPLLSSSCADTALDEIRFHICIDAVCNGHNMCIHMIFVQMWYFYKYVSMQISRAVLSGSGFIYVCQYTCVKIGCSYSTLFFYKYEHIQMSRAVMSV